MEFFGRWKVWTDIPIHSVVIYDKRKQLLLIIAAGAHLVHYPKKVSALKGRRILAVWWVTAGVCTNRKAGEYRSWREFQWDWWWHDVTEHNSTTLKPNVTYDSGPFSLKQQVKKALWMSALYPGLGIVPLIWQNGSCDVHSVGRGQSLLYASIFCHATLTLTSVFSLASTNEVML